ncbi:MAG: alpha-E domain-containing protein [Kofleriaceae bacterium]
MISRVADHCFWFGRYLERAESTARLLAATLSLSLDGEAPAQLSWRPLLVVAGEEPTFLARHGGDPARAWSDGERIQRFMTWDEANPVSLRTSIGSARWNAQAIRDVVSLEAWETVNELHLWLRGGAATTEWTGNRDGFYRHVRRATQLTLGLLRSTMLHDEPLNFIWLGVLLERVGQTARTLDVHHHAFTELADDAGGRHEVIETTLWLGLLRALSGTEPFMRRVHGRIRAEAVASFLLDERLFPRSIAYGVRAAHERLATLVAEPPAQGPGTAALARLRTLDGALAAPRHGDDAVHATLTHVIAEIDAVGVAIGAELLGG